MKRSVMLMLLTLCAGCLPIVMRDPPFFSEDVSVGTLPTPVRSAALQAVPGGQVVSASHIRVGERPDLYILKMADDQGKTRWIEVRPDGTGTKEVTEPGVGR